MKQGEEFNVSGEKLSHRPPQAVLVESLAPGLEVRANGLSESHLVRLTECSSELPPIIVNRQTMAVVDGRHRVEVAKRLGWTSILAFVVDGLPADMLTLALSMNSRHGLPLSMQDRKLAVRSLLEARPEWSDRRTAEVVGVSPGLVAKIRQGMAQCMDAGLRVGRDGRVRTLSPAEGRIRAAEHFATFPGDSLRRAAAAAGVSVATASDVRARLSNGLDPVPDGLRVVRESGECEPDRDSLRWVGGVSEERPPVVAGDLPGGLRSGPQGSTVGSGPVVALPSKRIGPSFEAEKALRMLRSDPSMRLTDSGKRMLHVFAAEGHVLSLLRDLVVAIPAHQVETVQLMMRSLSEAWGQLAADVSQGGNTKAQY